MEKEYWIEEEKSTLPKKKPLLVNISLFMIFLIITLPIYVSSVHATPLIRSAHVFGENGIRDYRKPLDFMYVEAEVRIDEQNLTPEEVATRVLMNSLWFSECEPLPNDFYKCYYIPPDMGNPLSVGTHTLEVSIRDAEDETLTSRIVTFHIDNLPPEVKSLSIDPELAGPEDNITIVSIIEDYAYARGDASKCAGLYYATIKTGETDLAQIPINVTGCRYTLSETLPATAFTSDTGTVDICVLATDVFGQEGTKICTQLTTDFNLPEATGFSVTHINGSPVEWVNNEGTTAIVTLNITEEETEIDPEKVYADLSDLTGRRHDYQQGSCNQNDERYNCVWSDVDIKVNESTAALVVFNISDIAGNLITQEAQWNIYLDNIRPNVTSVGPYVLPYNDTTYIGPNNVTFYAQFLEFESGISADRVFLDLSACGHGPRMPADNCTEQQTCFWYGRNCTADDRAELTFRITPDSSDNMGNLVQGNLSSTAVMDSMGPRFYDVQINTSGSQFFNQDDVVNLTNLTIVVKDDLLIVNATVVDSLSPEVFTYANFSGIRAGEMVPGDCVEVGRQRWECLYAAIVNVSGGRNYNFYLNGTDVVGNSYISTHSIFVYGYDNETEDYWTHSTGDPSPSQIDRQMMGSYQMFEYYPLTLNSDQRNIWPFLIWVDKPCYNVSGGNEDYPIEDYLYPEYPEIIDFNVPSMPGDMPYQMFLKLNLYPVAPEDDEVYITCPVNILSIIDNKTIYGPEEENITMKIEYYNLPYGSVGSEVISLINDTLADVQGGWLEWMDSIEKVIQYAQLVCQFIEILHKLHVVWTVVTSGFAVCCNVPQSATLCCPSQQTSAGGKDVAGVKTYTTYEKAKKYCDYLSCGSSFLNKTEEIMTRWQDSQMDGGEPIGETDKGGYGTFVSRAGEGYGWFGNVAIKESIVYSAIFMCLPGIVYNGQKWRSTKCRYAECLMNTAYGTPKYLCDERAAYEECMFVWGQIFNLLPFASAISNIGQNLMQAFSDPAALFLRGFKFTCVKVCKKKETGTFCKACGWMEFFNLIADIMCDMGVNIGSGDACEGVWESSQFQVEDSLCEQVIEQWESFDTSPSGGSGSSSTDSNSTS